MAKARESKMKLNEGIQVQEVRSCLLCADEGVSIYQSLRDCFFGAPGTWHLMRCPQCHLVWLNPRPVPQDVGKLYIHYFTHDAVDSKPSLVKEKSFIYRLLKNCLGKVHYLIGLGQEVAKLDMITLDEDIKKGRLLDVGCGNGQLLARMRELGWEVIGVEPDVQAVKLARERFGLSIHEGTLETAGFPDDAFDAILQFFEKEL